MRLFYSTSPQFQVLDYVARWLKIKDKWWKVGRSSKPLKSRMFIGEYQHTIDDKGRMAIPAKLRSFFSKGVVVTRGLDSCLFVFTKKEWDELAKKLIALPIVQAQSRAFVRLMMAGAMNLELDSQGRVLLPDYLRTYASLGKEAVVAGLYNRLEIWDRVRWEAYKTKTESKSDEIAENLGNIGI